MGVSEAVLKIKVLMDAAQASAGLDQSSTKVSKWGKGFQKAAVPAAAALTVIAAGAVKAANAAAEDAQGQALLAKALTNSTGASKASIAATEDWISKTAAATGVADDQLRPALGTLVRATGDVTKSQGALSAALDISAATGKDVESVSSAIAKGYAGNTTALGKLVPGIDKTVLASKDMNKIMAELARTTGGSAAAAAGTAEGKMARFHLALAETQEGIGGALLPILDRLSAVLLKVASWAQNNTTVFVILAGAIAGIAVAVLAVNAAMKVYQATMIVVKAIQSAVWLTNPIFLVIAAVILLVGAIVLLWKRSATFRAFVLGMWAAIRSAATAVGNAVRAVWNAVFSAITSYVNAYLAVFRAVYNAIRAVASSVTSAIRNAWSAVTTAVGNVVDKVRDLVGWFGRLHVPGLSGSVFDTIASAIGRAVDAVKSLIGWLGKIKVPKISLPKIGGRSLFSSASVPAAAGAPTVRGLSASPTTLRAGTSSGGLTIVVQGAIDTEGVARQIKRILGSHEQRVGIATTGGPVVF